MADDDDKRKRFLEDDDDDAPPTRPKRRGSDGPPVLFLVGLVAGVLAVTGCCGTSGWWVFAHVLRGGSAGGWSVFGSNEVEITNATRTPGFGFNAPPQVTWTAVGKVNAPVSPNAYFLVMQCGGRTFQTPFPSPTKGMTDMRSTAVFEFRNVGGPIDLWVEKRTHPNAPGTRVSNVYRVP